MNQCRSEGISGEIVFTTLTRQGMPLIRSRTGDIARMIIEPCPCGSHFKRMGYAEGRREGAVCLGSSGVLKISELDEALFGIQGLLDYRTNVSTASDGSFQLHIDVHRSENDWPTHGDMMKALERIGAIRQSAAAGCLKTPLVQFNMEGRWITTGAAKRKILISQDLTV